MSELTPRRVTQTAFGHTVFVRPPARISHAEWSSRFEHRALLAGYTAVIDGVVIDPGSAEASAAIAKLAGATGATT